MRKRKSLPLRFSRPLFPFKVTSMVIPRILAVALMVLLLVSTTLASPDTSGTSSIGLFSTKIVWAGEDHDDDGSDDDSSDTSDSPDADTADTEDSPDADTADTEDSPDEDTADTEDSPDADTADTEDRLDADTADSSDSVDIDLAGWLDRVFAIDPMTED